MQLCKIFLFIFFSFVISSCGELHKSDLVTNTDVLCSFAGKVEYNISEGVDADFDKENITSLTNIESSSCKNIDAGNRYVTNQSRVVRVGNTLNFIDENKDSHTVKYNSNTLTQIQYRANAQSFFLQMRLFNGKINSDSNTIIFDFQTNMIKNDSSSQNVQSINSNNEFMGRFISILSKD